MCYFNAKNDNKMRLNNVFVGHFKEEFHTITQLAFFAKNINHNVKCDNIGDFPFFNRLIQ